MEVSSKPRTVVIMKELRHVWESRASHENCQVSREGAHSKDMLAVPDRQEPDVKAKIRLS
jgi:hypothetical protein